MGQIFSRYFGRTETVLNVEEEDTSGLLGAQTDTGESENEENCFHYLKRKFTDIFCCQTSDIKRIRLEAEDEHNSEDKEPEVNDNIIDDEIQINDTVVEIESLAQRNEDPIIENADIKVSVLHPKPETCSTYLNHPFLTDIPSMESLTNSLTMLIMRGLPGSGKSTVVRKLKELFPQACTCSADDYFASSGVYKFDRTKLKDAHLFSQAKAEELCQKLTNLIIIDNTNVKRWEMAPYFRTASQHRYTVIVAEPRTPWKFNVDELVLKNTHSVDGAVIRARAKDWQEVQPNYYGWFLNPADTSLLLELGDSWLQKCLSNKEFFEDFSKYSNRYNLRSMLNFYSREGLSRSSWEKCHCTARFVKKGDTVDSAEEVDMLGLASNLHITGLVITPRTFGARVQLTPSQLSVYSQNDNEVELFGLSPKPRSPARPRAQADSPPCASLSEAISACRPSLVVDNLECLEAPSPLGRRAHITLGCAEGVRPVQTGLDQIQVLREQPVTSIGIPGGTLAGFGGGRWLLSLDKGVVVQGVFSGGY